MIGHVLSDWIMRKEESKEQNMSASKRALIQQLYPEAFVKGQLDILRLSLLINPAEEPSFCGKEIPFQSENLLIRFSTF